MKDVKLRFLTAEEAEAEEGERRRKRKLGRAELAKKKAEAEDLRFSHLGRRFRGQLAIGWLRQNAKVLVESFEVVESDEWSAKFGDVETSLDWAEAVAGTNFFNYLSALFALYEFLGSWHKKHPDIQGLENALLKFKKHPDVAPLIAVRNSLVHGEVGLVSHGIGHRFAIAAGRPRTVVLALSGKIDRLKAEDYDRFKAKWEKSEDWVTPVVQSSLAVADEQWQSAWDAFVTANAELIKECEALWEEVDDLSVRFPTWIVDGVEQE